MAARYANDVEIAKAHRDFELKKAHYDQEVQTKKAESDMAYELQVKKKRYLEIYIAILFLTLLSFMLCRKKIV